jgi:catechol 2,3-dioxygenase-like lactoylglutathione lyase family enzyme
MFSHIMVGCNDTEKAKTFYNAALGALGIAPAEGESLFYSHKGGAFGVGKPRDGEAATFANGGTIGFVAETNAQVDAFHAAGCANGGTCEGKPGKRDGAPGDNYGAYLRDPVGNKVCAFYTVR